MPESGPHIRISRSDDGNVVWLWINGATHTFTPAEWTMFLNLTKDFTLLGIKTIQNFADLPTKTPLHANRPLQPTADDLA